MQPISRLKRKIVESEQPPVALQRLEPTQDVVMTPALDLQEFKIRFDKGSASDRYLMIRELAMMNKLPISDIQTIIRQYTDFRGFELRGFIEDFKKSPVYACTKHCSKRLRDETTAYSKSHVDRIGQEAAKEGYAPDIKMIALLLADAVIKDSPYEGQDRQKSIEMFQKSYRIAEAVYGFEHPKLKAVFDRLHYWNTKLRSITASVGNEKALVDLSREILDEFHQTGEVFLSGGWKNKSGGHHMIYHLIRASGKTTVEIINSGDGLSQNHHSILKGNKILYFPVCRFENIDPARLTPNFLATLLGHQIIPIAQDQNDRGQEDIFEFVKVALNVPIAKIRRTDTCFITPQRAGTCAVRAILAFMHIFLTEEEYSRFKYCMMEMHLVLMQNLPNRGCIQQDIVDNLYRHIDNLFSEKKITFQEFLRTHALLKSQNIPSIARQLDIPKFGRLDTQNPSHASPPNNKLNAWFFEKTHTSVILVNPITKPEEILPNLVKAVAQLGELIASYQYIQANIFHEEVFHALPRINDAELLKLSTDELTQIFNEINKLKDYYLQIEIWRPEDKGIMRLYYYFLLVKIGQIILKKEFPDSRLSEDFRPFSRKMIAYKGLNHLTKIEIRAKLKDIQQFHSASGLNGWFDNSSNSWGFFIGPDTPIVRFIIHYLKAKSLDKEIPQHYSDEFYNNILFGQKSLLPPYVSTILNSYLALFTNEGKVNQLVIRPSALRSSERLVYGIINSKLVMELYDGLFPEGKPFAAPSVKLLSVLMELENSSELLLNPKFRKKLRHTFFKTQYGHTCLFELELQSKSANEFVERLRKQLSQLIQGASKNPGYEISWFLISFIVDLEKTYKKTRPDKTDSFLDLITDGILISRENVRDSEIIDHYSFMYLHFCEEKKQFDINWVKHAFGFLLCDSFKTHDSPNPYIIRSMLRYHEEEFKREFLAWHHQNPAEINSYLSQYSLSLNDAKIEWPWIHFGNKSYHIMSGLWKSHGSEIITIQPKAHYQPCVKTLFPTATQVVIDSEKIQTEDGRITILRKDAFGPIVHGSKLKEIYGQAVHFLADKGSYRFVPQHQRSIHPFFMLIRNEVWQNQSDKSEYFIYDTLTKRVIRCFEEKNNYRYEDPARQLILADSRIGNSTNMPIAQIFEEFDYKYLIWQSITNNDLTIEFPTYRLSFVLKENSDKIDSVDWKGFYLDPEPLSFPKANGRSFTLCNDNGERKFVIPAKEFGVVNGVITIERGWSNPEPYLAFNVIATNDGKFRFEGEKKELVQLSMYLAMVGEFVTAVELVKQAFTNKYDAALEKIFLTIFNSIKRPTFRHHPDYVAYRMHLAYAILWIQSPDSKNTNELMFSIKVELENYINNYTNANIVNRLNLAQALLFSKKFESSEITLSTLWHVYLSSLKGERFILPKKEAVELGYVVEDWSTYRVVENFTEKDATTMLDYRPTVRISDALSILIKVFLKALNENNSELIEKVLFRTYYFSRTTKNNFWARYLIMLINSPSARKQIKQIIKTNPEMLLQSDIHFECGNFMRKIYQLIGPHIPRTEPPIMKQVNNKLSVPGPSEAKRKASARNVPLAKEPRTSTKEQGLKDLLVEYFKPELTLYSISKLDLQHASVAGQKILDKITEDLSTHKSNTIFELKDPNSLPQLKEKLKDTLKKVESDLNEEYERLEMALNGSFDTFEDFQKLMHNDAKKKGKRAPADVFKIVFERYLNSGLESFESSKLEQSAANYIHLFLEKTILAAALKENNPHKIAQILQRPAGNDDLIDRAVAFYEVHEKKIFRDTQLKFVKEAQASSKAVLQLPSGDGKTGVITPELVLIELLKGKTVFVVVPKGNLETDYENLRVTMSKQGKCVQLLQFTRTSSDVCVEMIHDAVTASKIERAVFVSEPEAIQSLFLKYAEAVFDPSPDKDITRLNDIISHMSESTLIGDEIQIIFKLLHSLNYAYRSEKGLESYRWTLPQALYKIMELHNAKPDTTVFFPFGSRKDIDFSFEIYNSTLKPILLDGIAPNLPIDQMLLKQYVNADPKKINDQERAALNNWKESLPEELPRKIELLKALLDLYLPHCLKARCFVHYGPSDTVDIAIPYAGNNQPAPGSSFQTPDVTVLYTNQTASITGLKDLQLKQLILFLRKQSEETGKMHELLKIPEAKADLSIFKNLQALRNKVFTNIDYIQAYHNFFAFPDMRVNTERLTSTAFDLSYVLFENTKAFSATLLTQFMTLPRDYKVHFDSKVHAEMINLLLDPAHTRYFVGNDFRSLLKTPNLCMLLDPHYSLAGFSNKHIASNILETGPIKHVRYFDQTTNLLTSLGDPNERAFFYLDELHTTGVHTDQPSDGIGLILANKGLTFTDISQATKRLRQYGKGQKILIYLTPQIKQEILDKFNATTLTNKLVTYWTILNEIEVADKNATICPEMYLHAIYSKCLFQKLLAIKKNPQKIALAAKHRRLGIQPVDIEEFRIHGSLELPKTPSEKFKTMAELYEKEHGDLLDDEAKQELQFLKLVAEKHFEGKGSSDLTGTLSATTQQQAYKESQDYFEVIKPKRKDNFWHVPSLFSSQKLADSWNSFKSDAKIPLTDFFAVFPLSYLITDHHFPENIYLSDSFGDHRIDKNRDIYKDCMPPIEFVLELINKKQPEDPKYIVITKSEAHRFRNMAKLINQNDDSQLPTNASQWPIVGHLHLLNGVEVISTSKEPRKLDVKVQAVLKFLNNDTKYEGPERQFITNWLKGEHLQERINRFLRSLRLRKVELRHLEGTAIQDIFKELKKGAKPA